MTKIVNVDIISFMKRVGEIGVRAYDSDLDIDIEEVVELAQNGHPEQKYLLWMVRPSGTWLYEERTAYIKNTSAYNTWQYYEDKKILAYAIHITSYEDGIVRGDVWEVDYLKHKYQVEKDSIEGKCYLLEYENGSTTAGFNDYLPEEDEKMGKLLNLVILSQDDDKLSMLLRDVRRKRNSIKETYCNEYINALKKRKEE